MRLRSPRLSDSPKVVNSTGIPASLCSGRVWCHRGNDLGAEHGFGAGAEGRTVVVPKPGFFTQCAREKPDL